MSSFLTEQIDLSMCSTQTGLPLTANVYTLEGVTAADGSPRLMSIGQLVMAICLQRAAALERDIVDLMDAINQNTALINGLTTVESELVTRTMTSSRTRRATRVFPRGHPTASGISTRCRR